MGLRRVAVLLLVALVVSGSTGASSAGAADRVTVHGRGFTPDAAVVVAQCSRQALAAALTAVSSALDYCDQDFVAVTSSGPRGAFSVAARALPVIQTASGRVDCRRTTCLLGALNLDALQGKPLQVAILPLHFSPTARVSPPPRAGVVTGRRTVRAEVRTRGRGEGLLALTMSAPGTSWASARHTSAVVRARVDREPWQTIVLFEGARRFTYQGFTGPLRAGRHQVQIRSAPSVRLAGVRLRVLSAGTRSGIELAHAPVLYDRRVATTRDTPLITYATDQRLPGGARRLAYTVVWSREDAGTGFLPWLEWGSWGRMTDIETAISFDVARTGAVSHATYLTCSLCGPHFPDSRTALNEVERPFRGRWYHGHPVLRVATGNNDFSDQGVTPLRFQPALAPPPPPGDPREGAMDRSPWTYGVMGQELSRARADYSTSAASAGPGDPRQYLIVQLDTSARDAAAVGVDIRLAGSSRVYSNDLGTTYPLYDGGAGRTVVKVPLGLVSHPITLVRLRLLPASGATPSITIHGLRVLQYTGRRVVRRASPRPRVVVEPVPSPATGTPTITAQ